MPVRISATVRVVLVTAQVLENTVDLAKILITDFSLVLCGAVLIERSNKLIPFCIKCRITHRGRRRGRINWGNRSADRLSDRLHNKQVCFFVARIFVERKLAAEPLSTDHISVFAKRKPQQSCWRLTEWNFVAPSPHQLRKTLVFGKRNRLD